VKPQQIGYQRYRSVEVLEALAVYALLNADAKGDHVRVRLTFAEIPLEEIPDNNYLFGSASSLADC
jgi:hypothetical protein